MREWLWRHRMAAFPCVIVLGASAAFLVSLASGTPWPLALVIVLVNAMWWGGILYLIVRAARKRTRTLEEQGIIVYIRYPGSRPGSLGDVWAGGTANFHPGQIVFQETMAGTDVPLGKPTKLDIVATAGHLRPDASGRASHLPPGLGVMTLALASGTVEIAAEPSALARLEQEVSRSSPTV